ncbi:hypothetical protein HS99_0009660 [Kitasatospora aureofaciens]|uniref:Lipoprotein n=2 Tax=Kitasatospora aureofaciens TaxID=1894 RepID=A0A1E7N210_KITAU|nr:hypothetical protein [Kitasatospora aureofaciens]QEV03396.1 hypothetical protein CP971_33015 [Streptomyces viridifaciens]ARF81898.1 hypothetical protein B6264_26110 [Kitasatospora aureofaciens]OEV34740.1 hypothetical protein HS99_0009660 [Kitasatospora aureofaciens]UKZ03609.1 hypothetical protein BOQ63_005815 [Streptomyces viridifaciens]GGU92056.1 hypothetical protein GCM10010502_51750 [Kitasatospora aureofaciens]
MKTHRTAGLRARTAPAVLAVAAVLAVGAAGCDSAPSEQLPATEADPSSSAPAGPPDFTLFTGTWGGHGNQMTVNADGSFTMEMRTGRSGPSDSSASGRIDSVSGTVAKGAITTTGDHLAMPVGPLTFVYDSANNAINALRINWCGPKAPVGVCV